MQWPGYSIDEPFYRTKNVKRQKGAITRATIVDHLVEITTDFIEVTVLSLSERC